MALKNEIKSWVSSVASLSDPFNADSRANPEKLSSALTLKQVEYFHKASVILDTPGDMTSIASRVSIFQRELVALRGSSKDKPDNERIALRERIARTLKSCRQGRMDIAAAKVVCDLYIKDIGDNAGFYNEHLDRVGMSQNNPLRPEAYCVIAPQSEQPAADTVTPVTPKSSYAGDDNYQRALDVHETLKEFRRMMDENAIYGEALTKFVKDNPFSIVAQAFGRRPKETSNVCSQLRNTKNLGRAYIIVSYCLSLGDESIRKAWSKYRQQIESAEDARCER